MPRLYFRPSLGLGSAPCGCAIIHQVLVLAHVLHYGSQMAANFYGAILGFCVAFVTTLAMGRLHTLPAGEAGGQLAPDQQATSIRWPALAAGVLLATLFVAFNVMFW
ncbi:MAG: hypothetical protein WBA18_15550 [Terracidiphilus sp.]